ncbi:hypothetical protein ACJMK2_019038 [Sinanodonta woodiana]|uniref:TIR domain-containing protein n=1 Tax=Sinanodonta woodiana TaxID=1069815 RepID=A0ABD3UF66_SINWO
MASLDEPAYDVFLVHCEADKSTAMHIDGVLSKAGMKCIASFKDNLFPVGREILENIKYAVENSRLTLVLLTKESKNSPWVTLETVLALEKSQRLKHLCIRLLLQGIEKSDERELKVGILGNLPHLFIDVGSGDWEDRLVESIREPCPISKILPAGNIALGQVYSLVVGYYGYILPALKDGLTKSNYYFPGRTSLKFFILLPHDSKTYRTITDYEQRIRHVGKIDVTQKVHVGKPREYKVDLYSIKDNSVTDDLCSLVLGKIKEELTDESIEKVSSPVTRLLVAKEGSKRNDATITYCNEVAEDSKVAERIESALEAHGWKFEDGTGHSNFSYIGCGKWKIFVLSKEGLQRKLLKPQFIAAVTDSIDENRLCVIPVLRGMKIQEVPDCIKWVTYLSSDEGDCEERLIQTMKGEEMIMETRLPSGDVATGLAWGFILNYLPIPLLGMYIM